MRCHRQLLMACVKRVMMPFTSGTMGCKAQKMRRSSLVQLPRHESLSQPDFGTLLALRYGASMKLPAVIWSKSG